MNAPISEIRLPPMNVAAEQSVLGGLMLNNNAWDRIADVIAESDFFRDDHRRIFAHIRRMIERGLAVDVLTVCDALQKSNEAEMTGGLAYLGEIANNTPSAANIRRYAEIVAQDALRRRMIEVSDRIAGLAWSSMDARPALDEAQGLLWELADTSKTSAEAISYAQALAPVVDEIQQLYDSDDKGGMVGLATGFADIDAMLLGLQPGQMIVVAGRPSMGKTALAMNIAEHVATNLERPVAIFSLEMTARELSRRSLASLGEIPFEKLRNGRLQDDDWVRMTGALGRLHSAPIQIDDSSGLTVSQIHSRARRIHRQHGALGLIVVDYMQMIRPATSKTATNRNDEVTEISRGLKTMAKDLGVPVICLSQLSRKVEERVDNRPIMSDLRESGSIEQDADVVAMLYRDDYYHKDSPWAGFAEVIIGKHRNGRTGKVNLIFQGQYSRFRDADHSSVEEALRKEHEARPMRRKSTGFAEGD